MTFLLPPGIRGLMYWLFYCIIIKTLEWLQLTAYCYLPAGVYLFRVNNQSRHWRRSGVFTVNCKQISHIFLAFPWYALKNRLGYCWSWTFKNGLGKIFQRQPLSRTYPCKFFKGCLPQILLGPFLNTLLHIIP